MVAEAAPAKNVLVVNRAAGSVSEDDLEQLTRAFPDALLLSVGEAEDLHARLAAAAMAEDALVVAVGGDGTVSALARELAGTEHALGIIPRGTFNNFAKALGVPLEFEAALDFVRREKPRPVTYGSVNGRPFLELAAIGLFGDALALGEASKERDLAQLRESLLSLVSERAFEYRLSGDSTQSGRAISVLVTNTPSTGAGIGVGETTPDEASLELTVIPLPATGHEKVRRVRVETTPNVPVYADASEAGHTPVEIEAVSGRLKVVH